MKYYYISIHQAFTYHGEFFCILYNLIRKHLTNAITIPPIKKGTLIDKNLKTTIMSRLMSHKRSKTLPSNRWGGCLPIVA